MATRKTTARGAVRKPAARPAAREPVRGAGAVGPDSLDGLRALVDDRYATLAPRLQAAVRFLVDHPAKAGVETVKSLADAAGVQPSVMVRLAKALGYSGFSQM